jgi:hypothetical protein
MKKINKWVLIGITLGAILTAVGLIILLGQFGTPTVPTH